MASIRTEIRIDARPGDVWDALRDWGAVHERVMPGFVTDARLDGDDRIVTFINGSVAREVLVDRDDDARRIVWTVVEGRVSHYNAAVQVFAESEGQTRFVWITDLLPNDLGPYIAETMERGTNTAKQTFESSNAPVT